MPRNLEHQHEVVTVRDGSCTCCRSPGYRCATYVCVPCIVRWLCGQIYVLAKFVRFAASSSTWSLTVRGVAASAAGLAVQHAEASRTTYQGRPSSAQGGAPARAGPRSEATRVRRRPADKIYRPRYIDARAARSRQHAATDVGARAAAERLSHVTDRTIPGEGKRLNSGGNLSSRGPKEDLTDTDTVL